MDLDEKALKKENTGPEALGCDFEAQTWQAAFSNMAAEWACGHSQSPSGLMPRGRGRGRPRGRLSRFVSIVDKESKEKKYECAKCGASYKQSTSLWRHRQKCEGRFAMLCNFCDMTFHRKDHYRLHLFSKHDYIDPQLGPPGGSLSMSQPQAPSEAGAESESDAESS